MKNLKVISDFAPFYDCADKIDRATSGTKTEQLPSEKSKGIPTTILW